MIRSLFLLAAFGLSAGPALAADTYTIDPGHSQVRFVYNHMGFSNILGLIGELTGEIVYDADNVGESRISASIPLGAIRTGYQKLDEHLSAEDFFDIARFPAATFTSTAVESAGEGKLKVTGDFTLHGVTRPVTLDVTLNGQGAHPMTKAPAIGFDARTTIKRSDYGIDKYVPAVGDEVQITVTIEAAGKKAG
ncbi:MAG: YceI family protein [Lysobacteraceae bacterium]